MPERQATTMPPPFMDVLSDISTSIAESFIKYLAHMCREPHISAYAWIWAHMDAQVCACIYAPGPIFLFLCALVFAP